MAIVNLEDASRLTGKSRATIYRAVKSGRLSKSEQGFDTTELLRVFGPFRPVDSHETSQMRLNDASCDSSESQRELVDLLRQQLKTAEERERRLCDEREELLRLLKAEQEQVRLLTYQTAPGPRRRFNWPLAVILALLFTLVAYVGSLLVLTPEPAKQIATPQKSPPPAPSEIWKPDSNGG